MDCCQLASVECFYSRALCQILGIYIGPAAGSKMWNGVIAKYNNRILEMKTCQAPLAINCRTYNSRIVPTFNYVAQLVPLPKSFEERYGMCSVIRATHCMRTFDFYQLHKLGGPKFRSISVYVLHNF